MGTRFMATTEAPIHDNIKQALVDADERDTTHVMRSVKNTERVFKNGEHNLGHNRLSKKRRLFHREQSSLRKAAQLSKICDWEDRLFHWAACSHRKRCAAETSLKVTEIEAENPGDFNAFGKYMKGTNYKESFQESGDTESSVWSCGLTLVRAQTPSIDGLCFCLGADRGLFAGAD